MELSITTGIDARKLLTNWKVNMDATKYKSVAINLKTYKMLETLASKKFELPISLSKTVEFFVTKGFEQFQNDPRPNK